MGSSSSVFAHLGGLRAGKFRSCSGSSIHSILFVEGIGRLHDDPPFVDRAGRDRRGCSPCSDCTCPGRPRRCRRCGSIASKRAGHLAGIAADADFRVDQVLFEGVCSWGALLRRQDFTKRDHRDQRGAVSPAILAAETGRIEGGEAAFHFVGVGGEAGAAFYVHGSMLPEILGRAATGPPYPVFVQAICSVTYSKSPGLLSIPTFGRGDPGGVLARLVARDFISDCDEVAIRLGRQPLVLLRVPFGVRNDVAPSGSELIAAEKTPIWRWNASCGSLNSLKSTPAFWITLFQRPTPPEASLHVVVAQAHVDWRSGLARPAGSILPPSTRFQTR